MKKNDIVAIKEHLVGKVIKVQKGGETVVVEFRIQVGKSKKYIRVISKFRRQSVRIIDEQ